MSVNEAKETMKKELKEKGFIQVAVDLRNVDLKEFINQLKSNNYWVHIVKIINLEGKPLMAEVIYGLEKPTIENLTKEDQEKMIKEYLEE